MSYLGPDYFGTTETGLADLGTLDVVESIDTAAARRRRRSSPTTRSDDIVFGGPGDDHIDAGAGQNIVFGDHGRILGVDTGVNRRSATASRTDDDYQDPGARDWSRRSRRHGAQFGRQRHDRDRHRPRR